MKVAFVFLLLIRGVCLAQAIDTITVTTDKTVYVLFDSDVSVVDLGTKQDYAQQINENIVMLKAIRENVKSTSLMVKTKTDIFVWIIKYRKEPRTLRVDTRKSAYATTKESKGPLSVPFNNSDNMILKEEHPSAIVLPGKENKYKQLEMPIAIRQRLEKGNREVKVKDELMQGKIYSVFAEKQNFRDLGEISNGIYFSLHDLAVDAQYLYIKMGLFNTSSIAFDLDVVYFERNQGKTLKKREAYASKNIPSVFHESVVTVQPSAEEIVVFVLDLFAYQDKDKLMVKVNERGGVRSLQFYIPAKSIVNSKSL